jgi:serine phosphatase RsbU (regulator of sigma subunit)
MQIQIAIAKTNKYASRESGDTAEVVERPRGGVSAVLADGQGSGAAAKNISHTVITEAISLIKRGARDGVVARAAHDHLYTHRGGKVSATLAILSVDLVTRTLVITRNSHCPVFLLYAGSANLEEISTHSDPIGTAPSVRPAVTELPLVEGIYAVTYSDGVMEAGRRDGQPLDIAASLRAKVAGAPGAQELADSLLAEALEADASRPADDMTVLVLATHSTPPPDPARTVPLIRRMWTEMPVD